MSYEPQFTITPALLARVESIAALRERIQGAAVQVPWIPALQKDTRTRNTHSSTAIEGNPLTLEEVRALVDGTMVAAPARARREVLNYFAALRHVEQQPAKKRLTHEDIFRLHAIMGKITKAAGPERRFDAIGTLGCSEGVQTGRDGLAASAGEGRPRQAGGHVEDRALCFEVSAHAYTEDRRPACRAARHRVVMPIKPCLLPQLVNLPRDFIVGSSSAIRSGLPW